MSNLISRGGIIARTTSGNVVPIVLVPEAVGDGVTDDTAAFNAAIAALPATGGAIYLEAGKQYAVNLVIDRDGVTFIGQSQGGDGNVNAGLTAYNAALPVLTLGGGTTQRRGFSMIGGRIYAQTTKQKGLLIQGMADVVFMDVEFGGFTTRTVEVTNTATASSYFINFIACKFFAVAALTGNLIYIHKVAGGFTTTVNLIGGNVDGSALGAGGMALRIADSTDIWCQGTHFQVRDGKGIAIEGAAPATGGRWHASECIVDTSDNPATAVLVTWPSTELYCGSYVIGADIRINGQGRNSGAVTVDLRGTNQFGHGFLYAPQIFDGRAIGFLDLIPTFQTTGPRITPIGGSPEGSLVGSPGDIAISVNNTGSSNTIFVKASGVGTNTGWQRLASSDYYQQTAPAPLASAATVDLLHDAGTFNFISGVATITSLGTDTAIDSGRIRRVQATGAFTFTHTASPTGGQMFCLGQANVTVVAGDVIDWLWQGSGSGWRMLDYRRFDGRPFRPGRAAYAPACASNLRFAPSISGGAQAAIVAGQAGSPEAFAVWDLDPNAVESVDVCGVFDSNLLSNSNVVATFYFISTATTGDVRWRCAFRRLTAADLDTTTFNYVTNAVLATVTTNATAGVPAQVQLTFTPGTQLDSCVAGDFFLFRISRFATDAADTLAVDARVLENSFKLHAT